MSVGTQATVKGLWPAQLREAGAKILLSNTYHLSLRPGTDTIKRAGGLHGFMGWDGPILTDSGGFQVFSLKSIRKISEEGVDFRSHIDGSPFQMTPESSIQAQNDLGADIIMAFDECPPLPSERKTLEASLHRTARWLERCIAAHQRKDEQWLFGIVQGGLDLELRSKSLELTMACDVPGVAIGGLSVGESRVERLQVLDALMPQMPDHLPRYLMGVGTPLDLIESVARGVDMFDCVMPTRNGRHGVAFTDEGKLHIRRAEFRNDVLPLDPTCSCPTCREFSRAYLRHLFVAAEPLGAAALSLHNIAYYQNLMKRMREAILSGQFVELCRHITHHYLPDEKDVADTTGIIAGEQ